MTIAHRGFLLGCARGLDKGFHGLDNLIDRTTTQPLLLRPAPSIRLLGPATVGGGPQIPADMIEVAEEGSLALEDFLTLQADPFSPIAQGVDGTVGTPAGQARAVPPPATGFFNATERGPVDGGRTVLGLRGHQAHLLPLPRSSALAGPRFHRADQRSVGLRNDMLIPHRR